MITIILEFVAFYYAIVNKKIKEFIIINMLLINLFAPLLMRFLGIVTNVGNIFYSSVIAGQSYILLNYGKDKAVNNSKTLLYTLGALLIITYSLNVFVVVNGNQNYFNSVLTIINYTPRVIFASIFAFIIANLVLIETYTRLNWKNKYFKITFSMILCQIIDSLIFFPIAFGGGNWFKIMLGGVFIKIFLGLLYTPLLLIKK